MPAAADSCQPPRRTPSCFPILVVVKPPANLLMPDWWFAEVHTTAPPRCSALSVAGRTSIQAGGQTSHLLGCRQASTLEDYQNCRCPDPALQRRRSFPNRILPTIEKECHVWSFAQGHTGNCQRY